MPQSKQASLHVPVYAELCHVQPARQALITLVWIVALQLICLPLDPELAHELYKILLSFFSWRNEFEADYIGMMLMASARYDPRVAPKVYVWLGGGEEGGLSATHPPGSKRAEKLNKPKVMQKAVTIYKEVRRGHGVTSFT